MAVIFTIVLLGALAGIIKPYINGSKRWHFGLAALVSFLAVGITVPPTDDSSEGKSDSIAENQATVDSEVDDPPQVSATRWQYQEDVDQMRGETSYYASLRGTNTVNLDFPYGEQQGTLWRATGENLNPPVASVRI